MAPPLTAVPDLALHLHLPHYQDLLLHHNRYGLRGETDQDPPIENVGVRRGDVMMNSRATEARLTQDDTIRDMREDSMMIEDNRDPTRTSIEETLLLLI
jgi:hypothetical protein